MCPGHMNSNKSPPLELSHLTPENRVSTTDLLKAMYSIYSRGGKTPEPEDRISSAIPRRISYSVRDKSREIIELLRNSDALLNDIYRNCHSRSELVATFVSVLELCSMGSIILTADGEDDCTVSFSGGDTEAILESISD